MGGDIMNIKHLYEEMCKRSNYKELFEEWVCIFGDLLAEVKADNPKLEKMVLNDLYVSLYGEHFNKENAMEAVSNMENEDGSMGEHWSITETTRVANDNRITFNGFNEYDWYYVLNMVYSDYCKIFNDDNQTYIKLAKAWLNDIDVPEGKAWRYYTQVVK